MRNRLDSDPPLSEDKIKKLTYVYNSSYSDDLNYLFSIFFIPDKTAEYASMIIKYLLLHGTVRSSDFISYKEITYTELRKNLVKPNGKKKYQKINKNKIPYHSMLSRILDQLVGYEILVKDGKINKNFSRTKSNKTRPTSYYHINENKIFWTFYREELDRILGKNYLPSSRVSYKKLYEKLLPAMLEIVILSNQKYDEARMLNNFNHAELSAACELLREHGIADPDKEIMDRIKQRDPSFYSLMNENDPGIYGSPLSDLYYKK